MATGGLSVRLDLADPTSIEASIAVLDEAGVAVTAVVLLASAQGAFDLAVNHVHGTRGFFWRRVLTLCTARCLSTGRLKALMASARQVGARGVLPVTT